MQGFVDLAFVPKKTFEILAVIKKKSNLAQTNKFDNIFHSMVFVIYTNDHLHLYTQ